MELDPAALLANDRRLRRLAHQLVRESGAEDLVQETWLAALEQPAEVRSLPAWLAKVARRMALRAHRARERRAHREAAVARGEALPSTGEILAREESRQRVVAALRGLEEPLRTTLVLRFLEDLPPRAVAARMQVPVETVRTRTRRGLALLRAALDRDFGARERWLSAIAPLLRLPRASGRLSLASLSLPSQLAAVLAALACLFWLLRPAEPAPTGGLVEPLAAALPPPTVPSLPGELRRPRSPETTEPRVSLATVGSTEAFMSTGAVRVQVLWPDGTPAAGVPVRLVATEAENPSFHALDGESDGSGVVSFATVPGGTALVCAVARESGRFIEITPGVLEEVELRLERGIDVAGLVVDCTEQPVPQAEVWGHGASALLDGICLAHSGGDGRFFLRDLSCAWIGARAAAHGPTRARMLNAQPGAVVNVRLQLGPVGGAVDGAILALGTGSPLAGVLVRIGGSGSPDDPEPLGGFARSDAQGRFRIAGLAAGSATVLARGEGLALFRGAVEVPEQGEGVLALELAPEAVLVGHVHDATGAALAGIRVNVGELGGPFEASAVSAFDGAFRIGALEPESMLLAWIDDRHEGDAETEFRARAGESATWEAVVERGGVIRGRVLDASGEPLALRSVLLEDEGAFPGGSDRDSVTTAADGSFLFPCVHERPHRLSVFEPGAALVASASRRGVRPGADEQILRVEGAAVPSARIVGTFLDEVGRPIPDAQVLALVDGQRMHAVGTCDPTSGRFELGPYPPRLAFLHLRAPGHAPLVLAPHTLLVGETWDVGTQRLGPEGRLLVRLVPLDIELEDELELSLGTMDEPEGTGLERSLALPPGPHALYIGGGSCAESVLAFEIQAGVETVLEVPLRRGWRTAIGVRTDAPQIELRLDLAAGGVLTRTLRRRQGELLVGSFRLAPGLYPVEVWLGERLVTDTLLVAPEDHEDPSLVLSPD